MWTIFFQEFSNELELQIQYKKRKKLFRQQVICHLNKQTLTSPQLIKRISLLIDLRISSPELTLFTHTSLLRHRTNKSHKITFF